MPATSTPNSAQRPRTASSAAAEQRQRRTTTAAEPRTVTTLATCDQPAGPQVFDDFDRGASPGVGPGFAADDDGVGDEDEEGDGEGRHQRGELEPEGAARRDPVPEEAELRAEAAHQPHQPAGRRVRLHPAHRRRAGSPRPAGSATDDAIATTTTISVASRKAPLPAYFAGGLDAAREEVADQDVGAGPEAGAEDAVGDEGAVAHPGAAGDERGEGADEADEAADEDRLAAVAVEVVLDPLEALVADPDPRAVAAARTRGRGAGR